MDDTMFKILRADGSITVNKNLIFGIGLNEAIIFSELLSRYYYFKDRSQVRADDSFFNTVDDLHLGTGIGDRAQRTAISNLKSLKLIACQTCGAPPKRYFKINFDKDLINKYLQEGEKKIQKKKEEMQQKTAEKLMNTPFTANAEIESSLPQKLKVADGYHNNTNINNTKDNTGPLKLKYYHRKKNGDYSDYQLQATADIAYLELRGKATNS